MDGIGLYFDLFCYLGLLIILVVMTRVRGGEKVLLKVNDVTLPGTFIFLKPGLCSRVGLLNTPVLPAGSGILLGGAKSVHTRGMAYPIDLIFLDENNRILHKQSNVQPGQKKISGPQGTRSILELGSGSIDTFLSQTLAYSVVEVLREKQ
jgi:hypothetical protein